MAKKGKGSSVYKVIELVGTSDISFADAAQSAVMAASKTIKDIRVAEVTKLDLKVDKGGKVVFRSKLKLSFKYHQDD
jgi:flavin-binding protein dodecin